jgi:guanine nucleotide-binding protein G(i) subunit alpha
MRLIYHGGYSDHDREAFKPAIFGNIVQSMQIILEAMEILGLLLDDEEARSHADTIMSQPPVFQQSRLPPAVTQAIVVLWRSPAVQECFARSTEYQLNESAK